MAIKSTIKKDKPAASRTKAAAAADGTKPAPRKRKAVAEVVVAPVKVSRFRVGDLVSHPMFGPGKVQAVELDILTIDFDQKGTKGILDSFVTDRE